jgi:hypothetical protein
MRIDLLPREGQFYKANLHCHTTISDGHLYPHEIKEAYMKEGYSAVAFTDHDVLIRHNELTDANFVALNGLEYAVSSGKGKQKTCHFCAVALDPETEIQPCWHREKYRGAGKSRYFRIRVNFNKDEPDYERVYTPEGVSEMMRRVRDAGFFVTYNHPVWSQETSAEWLNYNGMDAMEIVNYSCLRGGYDDYNPNIYDTILRTGRRLFCIATDDNHDGIPIGTPGNDSFGGFTYIKAEKLEYRALTAALQRGDFYASRGPQIHEFWIEDGKAHVKCSPALRVAFHFARRPVRCGRPETLDGFVTEASAAIPENAVYVRVTVTDREGKTADSNAYFLEDVLKEKNK